MVSYNYMKSYEPNRLSPQEENQQVGYDVSDYQTVELLKKARDRDDLPDDEKEKLHRMAFDTGSVITSYSIHYTKLYEYFGQKYSKFNIGKRKDQAMADSPIPDLRNNFV